jgi:hypothetical protein
MYSAPPISPDGSRVYVVYERPTAPWPLADCPATFGNADIWSATTG